MISFTFVLVGFGIINGLIVLFIILILLQKRSHRTKYNRMLKAQNQIDKIYHREELQEVLRPSNFLLRQFMTLQDQIILDKADQNKVINKIQFNTMTKKILRQTKSLIPQRRLVAFYKIKTLISLDQKTILLKRLKKEKRENIKFVIVYALLEIMDKDVFQVVMDTVKHGSKEYQDRISIILNNHFNLVSDYIEPYLNNDSMKQLLCVLKLSIKNGNQLFSDYILFQIDDFIQSYEISKKSDLELDNIIEVSLQYLLIYHTNVLLSQDIFIKSEDSRIIRFVVDAYAKTSTEASMIKLLEFYRSKQYNEYYSIALSKMVTEDQKLLLHLIDNYHTCKHPVVHRYVIKVLDNKMEYILLKLQAKDQKNIKKIIVDVLSAGYTSSIIDFLNTNNIVSLEKTIFEIIKPVLNTDKKAKDDFCLYLDEDILSRLELTRLIPVRPKKLPPKVEKSKIIWILTVVFVAFFFFPMVFVLRRYDIIGVDSWKTGLIQFVVDANIYLMLYYLVANGIYLFLTGLSFYGARKQLRLWNIKTDSLLFEENLLPSISVLAPAYNEELSIIESISSLLNLTYPNYEIIVINDGSSDKTLQKVINHFQLKRRNYYVNEQLETKPIRGIYTNKEYPNLIMVDKVNGGKADALNVGINVSSKQYICGIDSDSVLDTDSLLRLSAVTLDERYPILAFGGNIVPANGCVIKNGKVEKRGFADGMIPRFQSLEYLRAFTTGRVGWSQMNSLLIISGAFGLFQRQSVIQIGGYITSSGILKKDSVGEDMELVVRLTHNALQKKQKYFVKYIFHANCYTELPSDTKTLLRQRNRWHRGLVDILSYYRKLFLNPRYKQIGLLAIPYFYFFEVIGPLFEVVGYSMLIVGLILGILSPAIVLGIFLASVWLGIVISLSSVYIAEFDESSISNKDIFLLIIFAVLENFGYRQMLSFHRAYSLFTALKESGKWGDQKRKGMTATPPK